MKENVICKPRSPKEDWILIKSVAKIIWEWIKIEFGSIH